MSRLRYSPRRNAPAVVALRAVSGWAAAYAESKPVPCPLWQASCALRRHTSRSRAVYRLGQSLRSDLFPITDCFCIVSNRSVSWAIVPEWERSSVFNRRKTGESRIKSNQFCSELIRRGFVRPPAVAHLLAIGVELLQRGTGDARAERTVRTGDRPRLRPAFELGDAGLEFVHLDFQAGVLGAQFGLFLVRCLRLLFQPEAIQPVLSLPRRAISSKTLIRLPDRARPAIDGTNDRRLLEQ